MTIRVGLALLLLALPSRALAYDTWVDSPLHDVEGTVVGHVHGVVPRTVDFRDATHADVTFSSTAAEIRGAISLSEGDTRIRSTRHLILSGSAFHVEVEPSTPLRLLDGVESEVALDETLPVEGLYATRWRVLSEETRPERAVPAGGCAPVHLWPRPRVEGPVIVTAPSTPIAMSAVATAPGWNVVWVHAGSIWLRGYTWQPRQCFRDWSGGIGRAGLASAAHLAERQTLPPNATIASSATAPWIVRIRTASDVEIVRESEHTFFRFPMGTGVVDVEGVVLR